MITTENSHDESNLLQVSKSNVINSLRGLLDSGDEVDKCNASRALGSIGATEAIDDLVLRLRDEDIDVCIDAAEALGKLRADRVVPALLDSLMNDPDGELKAVIVKALGEIRDERSIPLLLELAEQAPQDMVRDSNEEWDDWWDMQQQAVVALGNMRVEKAIPVLKKLLDDQEALDIEHKILLALVRIGNQGELSVIEQLQSPSGLSRRRAAHALSFSTNAPTLAPLAAGLKDASEDVRLSVLQALVDRRATRYLAAIELLNRDSSEKVRQASILASEELKKYVEVKTGPEVIKQLSKDPDAEVRATYLCSLQNQDLNIEEAELQQLVYSALNDSSEQVLAAAIPLLSYLSDVKESEGLLIELLQRPKLSLLLMQVCMQTLVKLCRWNDDVAQALTRLINHQESVIRLAALQALMSLEPGVDALKMTSQDDSPIDIVDQALNGHIVLEVEVAPPQETLSEEADQDDAGIEAQDPGEEEVPQVNSTLESILQDNKVIEATLGETSPPLHDEIDPESPLNEYRELVQNNIHRGEWLFDSKEKLTAARDVRRLAAQVLSSIPAHLSTQKATRIIDSLISALHSNDEKLRCHAADAIMQIALDNPKTPGIEYTYGGLITQFQSEQWDLKLACMRALTAIRNRAAIPMISSALEHQRTALRVQALNSITELQLHGDPLEKNAHIAEALPTLTEWVNRLIDYLQDAESGVRYAAVANLQSCMKQEEISQQAELIDKVIDKTVNSAFNNKGGRTRDMALVLKKIALEKGTANLLQRLKDLPGSYDRRFAIEMLEEMYRATPLSPAPI